jgi:hypothetical protein
MEKNKNNIGIKAVALFIGFIGISYSLKVFSVNNVQHLIWPIIFMVGCVISIFGLLKLRKYGLWLSLAVCCLSIYGPVMWLWLVFRTVFSGHVNTPGFFEYYFLVYILCAITSIVYLLKEQTRCLFK